MVDQLQRNSNFSIEPFDTRAAIEVATMSRDATKKGSKRGSSTATWAKIKYDRQIVAIAKVLGATTIYSDDRDVQVLAKRAKIDVIGLAALPLPPHEAQMDFHEAMTTKSDEDGRSAEERSPKG